MAEQAICSTHNVLNDLCRCTSKLKKLSKPSTSSPFSLCSNLFLFLFIFGFLTCQLVFYYKDSLKLPGVPDQNRRYIEKIEETGFIDFASASAGGKIIKDKSTKGLKQNPIDLLINENNEQGQCWGFDGHIGWAYIELSQTVKIKSVEIIHLNSLDYSSAPKNFYLVGVQANGEAKEILAGSLDMTIKSESRKSSFLFNVAELNPFSSILINVTSNHGGKQTCVYQLKIYGRPSS